MVKHKWLITWRPIGHFMHAPHATYYIDSNPNGCISNILLISAFYSLMDDGLGLSRLGGFIGLSSQTFLFRHRIPLLNSLPDFIMIVAVARSSRLV